ncbi:hypothetical protein [Dactylosporangium darangshiense]|uniref:hypothetical protein n=1 Tax=Dactylosporangium darangshiense TaxID=579108 RepID=UPI00363306AC
MSMHTWWVVLGLGGAGASLGILLVQVLFWQRLRRVGADPVGVFTQGSRCGGSACRSPCCTSHCSWR